MSREVELVYFKETGKYYSGGSYQTQLSNYWEIMAEVQGKINNKVLPGLMPGHSEFFVLMNLEDRPSHSLSYSQLNIELRNDRDNQGVCGCSPHPQEFLSTAIQVDESFGIMIFEVFMKSNFGRGGGGGSGPFGENPVVHFRMMGGPPIPSNECGGSGGASYRRDRIGILPFVCNYTWLY